MTDPVTSADGWSLASSHYQERVGKATLQATARIVQLVHAYAPLDGDSHCLDVGTGGGAVPVQINAIAPGTRILATDISSGMLEQVAQLKFSNVRTQIEDATSLSLPDNTFTHAFSTFAIQFTPDASQAVRELYKVLQPGGTVAIAIWGEYAGTADVHHRACRRLRPQYKLPPPEAAGAWRSAAEHQQQLQAAGFRNIEVDMSLLPYRFTSGEDFCEWWYGGYNPAPVKLLAAAEQEGLNLQELRRAMVAVVDEEFDCGKGIYLTVALGWGQK